MTATTDTEIARLRREILRLELQNQSLLNEVEMLAIACRHMEHNADLDAGQIYRLIEMNCRLVEANSRMTWTAVTKQPEGHWS